MKQKKDHTPLPLKIVRWIFPKLEALFPSLAHRYFIKLFFTPLRYPFPEKEKKAVHFAKLFSFEVNDKKIQGYTWGEHARYILIVHGWAGRATQFRRFVKPLNAAGYAVVGFDGPAHGLSTGRKTTILEFEECLKKIYDLKGEPEGILAHSFGGGAVLFSAVNGLPLKRLINIATPTIGDDIIDTYLAALRGSQKTKEFFKGYMMKTYGKPFDEFTSSSFVKRLPQPVDLLLVHDEDDREVPLSHAEHLKEIYPQAQLHRTNGLGHTRILRDNDVIKACVTFLQDGRLK